MLRAKSQQYKLLGKMAIVPSLFNINEPMIFGTPMVLNPIFFIPLVLNVPIMVAASYIMYNMGLFNAFNPTIQVPWIMPTPIRAFLNGGVGMMIGSFVILVLMTLLYFPFVMMADRNAYAQEQENEAKLAREKAMELKSVDVEAVKEEDAKSTKTKLRTN